MLAPSPIDRLPHPIVWVVDHVACDGPGCAHVGRCVTYRLDGVQVAVCSPACSARLKAARLEGRAEP